MIFEKSLPKPVSNWNICGSRLIFQEEPDSKEVWLVKLYEDKKPIVYKFTLPASVTEGEGRSAPINSYFDTERNAFMVPPEIKIGELRANIENSSRNNIEESQNLINRPINTINKSRINDLHRMRSLGEIRLDTEAFHEQIY